MTPPGFPLAMRAFRDYLELIDAVEYLHWLNQDEGLKRLYLEGYDRPRNSPILQHYRWYYKPTPQRVYYTFAQETINYLRARRPLVELSRKLEGTHRQRLLVRLATLTMPHPDCNLFIPTGWPITGDDLPHMASLSRTLTELEKAGLVEVARFGRKAQRVHLSLTAYNLILFWTVPMYVPSTDDLSLPPHTPADPETYQKNLDALNRGEKVIP